MRITEAGHDPVPMYLSVPSTPSSRRAGSAVAPVVPRSVSVAFALWMVALGAGLVETALSVVAIAAGRNGAGWAAVVGQVAVRAAAFVVLFLLAFAMRGGRSWARLLLAVGFGVFGTLSLAVGPFVWLGAGGSIRAAYAGADPWELAFTTSRAVHVLCVWAAVVCMFGPSASRYFPSMATTHRPAVFTTASADGISVRGHDEGHGPTIVMLGPGLDDGTRCRKIARILARRFRVIRVHRRPYRLDLPVSSNSIAHELDDVLAVVRAAGTPVLLYGHSDGAVIALEALSASPESFAGAVIFEPPVVIGPALGGDDAGAVRDARAALGRGRPGRAMAVFSHRVVGLPSWQARLVGVIVALVPKYRRLVPGQIASLEALDRLGVRLDIYARIRVPMVLLGTERSPSHLAERLDALHRVIPSAVRVSMPRSDHGADIKQPRRVAHVIAVLADQIFTAPS